MAFPDQRWIGFILMGLAVLILISGIEWDNRPWWSYIGKRKRRERRRAQLRGALERLQAAKTEARDDMQRRMDAVLTAPKEGEETFLDRLYREAEERKS